MTTEALRKVEAEAEAARHVAVRLHEALDALPEEDADLRRAARRLSEAAEAVGRKPPPQVRFTANVLVFLAPRWSLHLGCAVQYDDGATDFHHAAYAFPVLPAAARTPLADLAADLVDRLPTVDAPQTLYACRAGLTFEARFREPPTFTAAEFEQAHLDIASVYASIRRARTAFRLSAPPDAEEDARRRTPVEDAPRAYGVTGADIERLADGAVVAHVDPSMGGTCFTPAATDAERQVLRRLGGADDPRHVADALNDLLPPDRERDR